MTLNARASSALAIHRAIYKGTAAQAIIHAHPRNATLLSFFTGRDRPGRREWGALPGAGARVVAAPELMGWNLVAEESNSLGLSVTDQGCDAQVARKLRERRDPSRSHACHSRAVDHAAEFCIPSPRES